MNIEAFHYIFFPISLLLPSSWTQMPPSASILEYPRLMFFPKYDRPRFTPLQYNRQNCGIVHSNLAKDTVNLINNIRFKFVPAAFLKTVAYRGGVGVFKPPPPHEIPKF